MFNIDKLDNGHFLVSLTNFKSGKPEVILNKTTYECDKKHLLHMLRETMRALEPECEEAFRDVANESIDAVVISGLRDKGRATVTVGMVDHRPAAFATKFCDKVHDIVHLVQDSILKKDGFSCERCNEGRRQAGGSGDH